MSGILAGAAADVENAGVGDVADFLDDAAVGGGEEEALEDAAIVGSGPGVEFAVGLNFEGVHRRRGSGARTTETGTW